MEKCQIANICLLTTNVITVCFGIYYIVKTQAEIESFKSKYQWAIGDTNNDNCLKYVEQRFQKTKPNNNADNNAWKIIRPAFINNPTETLEKLQAKAICLLDQQNSPGNPTEYIKDTLEACVFINLRNTV